MELILTISSKASNTAPAELLDELRVEEAQEESRASLISTVEEWLEDLLPSELGDL